MTVKSIFFLLIIVVCLVLLTSYAFTGDLKFWEIITLGLKVGSLRIQGAAANVTYIFMNQSTLAGVPLPESMCSDTSSACTMDGFQNITRRTAVKTWVNRTSGDCDSAGVSVVGFVCYGVVANCRPPTYDYIITSSTPNQLVLTGSKWGGTTGNWYCNYTGYFNLEYFKHNGTWTINITTVVDSFTNYTLKRWYYAEMPGIEYPFIPNRGGGGAIPLGTVSSNQWNFGLGANISKNTGNVKLMVNWNVSNFTGAGYWIDTHGSCPSDGTFCVQNTTSNPFVVPENYENMSCDNAGPGSGEFIQVPFYPAGGVKRCGILDCSQDENTRTGPANQANYTLWWSIYIPAGQYATTYTNNINWNATPLSD